MNFTDQDRWAKSEKQRAKIFVKHVAYVFQPHVQENDEEILEFLGSPAQSVQPIKLFTPQEIKEELGLFHKRKARDMDLITPKIVKGITPQSHDPTLLFI